MAKSKKYKAEKQHQREEDLNETEALDNQFKALMEGRLMAGMVRPKGEKAKTPQGKGDDPDGAAFDLMRRELVFDSKAQVCCCGEQHSGVSASSCLAMQCLPHAETLAAFSKFQCLVLALCMKASRWRVHPKGQGG